MSPGCCPWRCCRSPSPEPDENGTTRIIRKTTKNGQTITTTTTTFTNHHSSTRGPIQIEPSRIIQQRDPEQLKEVRELNAKTTPTTGHKFEMECLNEHNRLRALHGCPPLRLNNKLSAISKKWAIQMAKSNSMNHSQSKYGENLYMCSGFFIDGKKAVESWYNEIKDYDFRNPGFSMSTGHFTQVVWKDSKELGVGVEIRGNTTWVVANYDPPGNVSPLYEQNVPRLLRP